MPRSFLIKKKEFKKNNITYFGKLILSPFRTLELWAFILQILPFIVVRSASCTWQENEPF